MGAMRTGSLAGVALAVTLAAAVRLPGLDNGLPQMEEPDAVFVDQALTFEEVERTGDPDLADVRRVLELYPHLLGRLLHALPGELVVEAPLEAPRAAHLEAAMRPHLLGRRLSALLSLLVVPAVYMLARAHLPAGWSCLAALFAATSLLDTALAVQARPHAALCAFVAWELVAAQRLARSPSLVNVAFAALTSGLALATLHSGAATLLPIAYASIVAGARGGWRVLGRIAFVAVGPAVALVLCYPFLLDGSLWGGRPWPADVLNGAGFARMSRTLWAFEPVLVLLSLVALVPTPLLPRAPAPEGRDARLERAVLASYFVPYATAVGLYYTSWHRFALPLMPVLALTAAAGARRIAHLLASRAAAPRAVGAAVGLAAGLFPTLTVARLGWLQALPPTTEVAAGWIEENLDRASTRLVESFSVDVPLVQSKESVRTTVATMRSPWQKYLHGLSGSPRGPVWEITTTWVRPEKRADPGKVAQEEVRRRIEWFRATHVLVMDTRGTTRELTDESPAAVRSLGGRLVRRFEGYASPSMAGSSGAFDQFGYEAIRIAWRARRLGPTLELYEVPESASAEDQ